MECEGEIKARQDARTPNEEKDKRSVQDTDTELPGETESSSFQEETSRTLRKPSEKQPRVLRQAIKSSTLESRRRAVCRALNLYLQLL